MDLSDDARTLWDAAQTLNARALNARALNARALNSLAKTRASEARALACAGPSVSRVLPPLLFMTDPERTPRPWLAAAGLPPGAAVIYRHFGAADAETTARRLRETTHAAGVILLVGQDDVLAETVGADGVHLPERDIGRAAGLRSRHPDWLLTAAVHAIEAASSGAGLDAFVLSPVFPAGGVSAARPALGVEGFAAAVRGLAMPTYALGGVAADNVKLLIGVGACGIAGVAAFQRAFAPS